MTTGEGGVPMRGLKRAMTITTDMTVNTTRSNPIAMLGFTIASAHGPGRALSAPIVKRSAAFHSGQAGVFSPRSA